MLKYKAIVTSWCSDGSPNTFFTTFGHMFEGDEAKEIASISSYFNGLVTVEFEILKRDCTPFD